MRLVQNLFPLGNVFHQFTKCIADMFKYIDFSPLQHIRMEYIFYHFFLSKHIGNRSQFGKSTHFFYKIRTAFRVAFPCQIRQFDAIHQCIKTLGAGFIGIRLNQWGDFFSDSQNVFVGKRFVRFWIRINIHIFYMQAHRKMFSFEFTYFGNQLIYQCRTKSSQFIRLEF